MAADCSMGYRDLIQNRRESLAWDMIRTAWARRQCEGSKLGGEVQETGRM
jgi:hypothetical protein